MEITIREARLEDSHAIVAILRALGWSKRIQEDEYSEVLAEIRARLERSLNETTHTILVAERQDDAHSTSIVGYTAVHWYSHLMLGSDGYVSELFVHPAATGQGIGTRLLKTVEAYAVERKCTRLLLMNRRIRESYSRRFYAKRGWEEQDAALFSRKLTS
jgi:GNAT superfamily N-acetyltransferase